MVLLCLLAAAAASDKTVAVLPIEPRAGALSAADAAALTSEVRAAARDAIGSFGFEVTDAEGAPLAALEAGAAAAVFGRAGQMEGATVVAIGVYKPGSTAPANLIRVMGIGIEQLKKDARAKVPGLLEKALGLAPVEEQRKQQPGTLRIPGGSPAAAAPA